MSQVKIKDAQEAVREWLRRLDRGHWTPSAEDHDLLREVLAQWCRNATRIQALDGGS